MSCAIGPVRSMARSTSPGFRGARRGGRAGRLVGQAAEDEALDRWRLAPVALERLQDQLNARVEADELVGPGADRRLAKALLADALDVLARHAPPRAGRERAVERWEIRPRLPEDEPHSVRPQHLNFLHRVLQDLRRTA